MTTPEYTHPENTQTQTAAPIPPFTSPRRRARRLVSGISATGALVLVALVVAALIVSHFAGPKPAGNPTFKATVSHTTPTPGSSGWVGFPGLIGTDWHLTVAPTDPRVVYEDSAYEPRTLPTLRRSDDDGVTWHTLPLPDTTLPTVTAHLYVSPLNAQQVFLTILNAEVGDAPDCHVGQSASAAANPGLPCTLNYSSTDGGAHWTLLYLPVSGIAAISAILIPFPGAYGLYSSIFQVQGSRLYATLAYYTLPNPNGRGPAFHIQLITSTDGGLNWQILGAALLPSGQALSEYAIASESSTIFVVTSSDQAHGDLPLPVLWRSDDAGAHWTKVGTVARSMANLTVVGGGGGAPMVLYMGSYVGDNHASEPVHDGGIFPTELLASTDGGKTWSAAPAQGIPASSDSLYDGPIGVLSDGSVILAFGSEPNINITTFYAWKVGETSWHQLAPTFTGYVDDLLVLPGAGGKQALWVVRDTGDGHYSLYHRTLA